MAATTVDRQIESYGEPIQESHVIKSGQTLKIGALANFDANGQLTDAADTASEMCAGIVIGFPDGVATGNGTAQATIAYGHAVKLITTADATSWLGKNVFVEDNQTVSGAGAQTNDVKVGSVCKLAGSTTTAYVRIRVFGASDVA